MFKPKKGLFPRLGLGWLLGTELLQCSDERVFAGRLVALDHAVPACPDGLYTQRDL